MEEQNGRKEMTESEAHAKFLKIAAEQGVGPFPGIDAWPGCPPEENEDEADSVDAFLIMLREWRREGTDRPTK